MALCLEVSDGWSCTVHVNTHSVHYSTYYIWSSPPTTVSTVSVETRLSESPIRQTLTGFRSHCKPFYSYFNFDTRISSAPKLLVRFSLAGSLYIHLLTIFHTLAFCRQCLVVEVNQWHTTPTGVSLFDQKNLGHFVRPALATVGRSKTGAGISFQRSKLYSLDYVCGGWASAKSGAR